MAALLERDGELEALDLLVERTLAGEPVLALIEGPAGIGKSGLLAAAIERSRAAGFRVLSARASDLERELPFGVVRQLFEPVLSDAQLAGPAERAARVFDPLDDGGFDVSFAVLDGLYWLTANVAADGPVALAVDDLHWCDRESLRFLAYLGRRLAGLNVLVATATRVADPQADARLLAEIAGDPATVSIRPGALSEAATTSLVRDRLGDEAEPAFCSACQEATGGNPLLLDELLKTLRTEGVRPDAAHAAVIRDIGPRAVSRTVLLRLARLPSDAAAVARAIAVLGDGASVADVATLAQLGEHDVAEGASALTGAEILRPEPPLGFAHPLVRDAVYHEIPPGERELLHARAARALADRDAAPERVANQLLAVSPRGDPWAAELLRDAGMAAFRRGAAESAVALLQRALDEPPPSGVREQVLLELGLAEGRTDVRAAVEHLGSVHDHLADPTQRAVAAQWLVRLSLLTGPPQESAAVAQAALAALPADSVGRRQQLEASELGAVVFGADVPGAAERFAALRRDGFGDGFGACSLAAVTAWDWAFTGGTASECAALAKHALANPHLMTFDHALTTLLAVGTLIMADDEEALGFSETAYDLARGQGSLGGVGSTGLLRAWAWLERGELTEAEAAARQGFDNMRLAMGAESPAVRYGGGFALRALTERGDRAGAQAVRAAIHDLHHGSDWDAVLLRGMAELALEEGDFAGAAQTADGMRDDLRAGANPAMAPWRSLKARAVTGLGRRDEAIELLEDELADARRWSAPRPIGLALRLLGEARGDMDVLREAVDVTAGSIARLEHARALAALGGALRHARKPSDARTPLREAYEIASRSGAQSLAEWTRSELYAAGSRPRRDALSGPDSLTPSERRVAELAAGGQSNRDIAQALYVTPKTVEVHLTSAYRKLGIARRSGLSEALNLGGHV